jgi:hypothetical protein
VAEENCTFFAIYFLADVEAEAADWLAAPFFIGD